MTTIATLCAGGDGIGLGARAAGLTHLWDIAGSDRAITRALIPPSRIVQISTRCLARWQTFPDTYGLPAHKTLAARIIGNAVPPLQYQKLIQGMLC